LKAIQKLDKLNHLHLTYLAESHERAFFVKPLPEPPLPEVGLNAPGGADMADDDDEFETEDEDEDDEDDDGSEDFEDFDEDEEYFSGTDDDMPELEPHDAPVPTPATTTHQPPIVSADLDDSPSDPEDAKAEPPVQPQTTHLPPRPQPATSTLDATDMTAEDAREESLTLGSGPERGIKICLNTPALIEKYIPIFIEEYNLDDPMDEAALDPLNPMNAVINSLGAMIGAGPPPPGLLTMPMPMPMPMPGGGGGFFLGGSIIPPPPQHQHQYAPQAGAGAAHGGPAAAAATAPNAGVDINIGDMDA